MFYKNPVDEELRFGDILQGQISVTPSLYKFSNRHNSNQFELEILTSNYSVILMPCCSIGQGNFIILTPLVPIKSFYFTNPYFKEDLTRINRQMLANQAMSPHKWSELTPDVQQAKLQQGLELAELEYFIYEGNDFLEKYQLEIPNVENLSDPKKTIEVNYYMIDFRQVTRIKSPDILQRNSFMQDKKIAQLSIEARTELRNKIGFYYANPPKEDLSI